MEDRLFITFDRAFLRLLVAPVETVHQAPNVITVVTDPELAPDHFCDARCGPHVGVIAMCQRPFEQYPQQTTLLDGLQFLRAAGRRADLQSFGASPSPGIVPSHHGTGGALDASRNLVE
jgi:hypothetical protein